MMIPEMFIQDIKFPISSSTFKVFTASDLDVTLIMF